MEKVYYVELHAGAGVLKCAGGCPTDTHEEFYRNYWGRFGHDCQGRKYLPTPGYSATHIREQWEKLPVRYRVVMLPEYLGDRIEWRDGRWQITEECARANALLAAYQNGL